MTLLTDVNECSERRINVFYNLILFSNSAPILIDSIIHPYLIHYFFQIWECPLLGEEGAIHTRTDTHTIFPNLIRFVLKHFGLILPSDVI